MNIIFTEHAKSRIMKRKITEDEVLNTIKHPEILSKREGKYYAQKDIGRGKIEVVYTIIDKYINVITIYWL